MLSQNGVQVFQAFNTRIILSSSSIFLSAVRTYLTKISILKMLFYIRILLSFFEPYNTEDTHLNAVI